MPANFIVNTNQIAPWIKLQFTDANGVLTDTPSGVEIEFDADNGPVASIMQDLNDHTKGNITFTGQDGPCEFTAKITGANDVNGQPFSDVSISSFIQAPRQAQITFTAMADPNLPVAGTT